jgi:ribosome recycling factor
MAEEHKIGVRDARRSAMEMVKELEDDGTISSDDKRRVEKQVQDLTDEHTKKIDEMIAHKEKEVLEV